jgi:DNA-directed RNA polymerase specialized sigma24 family protein
MTAKEFLRQYEHADRKVRRLEAEYHDELVMVDAIRSASDNDGMPHGSGISKPTEEKALRLADKHLRLINARLEAVEKRQIVFDAINDIDGIEGDLLFERYVKLRKWEEICVLLGYSWNGVHKAHRRALRMVEERVL